MENCVIGIAYKNEVLNYCLEHNCILDTWKIEKIREEFKKVKKGDKCFIYYVPEKTLYGIFEAKGEAKEFPETPFVFSKIKLDLKLELEKKENYNIEDVEEILKKAGIKFRNAEPENRVFSKEKYEKIIEIYNKTIKEKEKMKKVEEIEEPKRLRLNKPTEYDPTFEEIIGLKNLKEHFRKLKNCWDKKCKHVRLCQGFFLFGPPGTGKTLFAIAVAKEFDAHYCEISPSVIIGFPGEAEKVIEEDLKRIFRKFNEENKGVIIIDEADGIFPSRDKPYMSAVMARVVPTFLAQIDKLIKDYNYRGVPIFLFAISNYPEAVDPAFLRPGRFENLYYVGLPNKEEYGKLFEHYLNQISQWEDENNKILDSSILKDNLEKLSDLLNERINEIREQNKKSIEEVSEQEKRNIYMHKDFGKFSPADIEKIVNEAALEACNKGSKITLDIIQKVINNTYPSVTNEILLANEEFKKSHPHTKEA